MAESEEELKSLLMKVKEESEKGDMFELGEKSGELHRKVFAHAMAKGFHLVIGVGEESSKCICNLAYPKLDKLKRKFRVDVSAGDLVLLKASHSMKLGELLRDS